MGIAAAKGNEGASIAENARRVDGKARHDPAGQPILRESPGFRCGIIVSPVS
jgi:hypothetical protein